MNKYDPYKHHRRSIRLKDYDYASAGCYFVTICVRGGQCLLGDVVDGVMILNEYGRIAHQSWLWLAKRHGYISLDEHTVMPNHMHGIIIYYNNDIGRGGSRTAPLVEGGSEKGASRCAPTEGVDDGNVRRKPLGNLIGAFKTISTKRINELRDTPGEPFWQRNYWEHIIRNERALVAIREYIINNPIRWDLDMLHPAAAPNPFK